MIFPFQETSLLSKMWDIKGRSSLCNLILIQSLGKFLNLISVMFGMVILDFRIFFKTNREIKKEESTRIIVRLKRKS